MTSGNDKTLAPKELQGWLTTMHVHAREEPMHSLQTIRPSVSSLQPLLRAFASSRPGSSAAPISVGKTLAEGGMGIVKLAEQPALGRNVVVKTLRGDFVEMAAEHVLREAWATGALEHPNIVPVHDVRVDDNGAPVIVLKKIEGDSWSVLMHDHDKLKQRFAVTDPLDWNLDILRQVCQAVRYAHSRGILHRDLKPDNVMIGEFGEVYLVDWGIALSLRDSADCPLPSAKHQTEMAGTPCYLAPEMLGDSALDARTDIYLLGSVLFEILAGRPPHRTDNLETLLGDIRASTPDIPESAPLGLASICRTAMSALPKDRFADANAFAIALQAFNQRRGSEILADQARAQLRSLHLCLAEEKVDNQEAYRFFGAVRFGYETALATWPENSKAVTELDSALASMIDFELTLGRVDCAQGLLEHMHAPPAALLARLEEQASRAASDQAALAKYRDDANLALGGRTRRALTLILGLIWTSTPLVAHFADVSVWRNNYGRMTAFTVGFMLLVIGFWFWGRDSLTRTEANRRIMRTLMTVFPGQILLFAGASLMGLPYINAELLMLLLWANVAVYAVAIIEPRFWPTMLVYAASFLIGSKYPEIRYIAMAVSNFTFMVNGLWIWRTPETELRTLLRRCAPGEEPSA